jgi:hypothetical protein
MPAVVDPRSLMPSYHVVDGTAVVRSTSSALAYLRAHFDMRDFALSRLHRTADQAVDGA